MGSTGTLNDVAAALLWLVADLLPALLVLAGGAGGVGLASMAGFKLWQLVQQGDRHSGQGSALGWVLGIIAGALLTLFAVWVALFSFLFTGWG